MMSQLVSNEINHDEEAGRNTQLQRFLEDANKMFRHKKHKTKEKVATKTEKSKPCMKIPKNIGISRGLFEDVLVGKTFNRVIHSPLHQARLNEDIFALAKNGSNTGDFFGCAKSTKKGANRPKRMINLEHNEEKDSIGALQEDDLVIRTPSDNHLKNYLEQTNCLTEKSQEQLINAAAESMFQENNSVRDNNFLDDNTQKQNEVFFDTQSDQDFIPSRSNSNEDRNNVLNKEAKGFSFGINLSPVQRDDSLALPLTPPKQDFNHKFHVNFPQDVIISPPKRKICRNLFPEGIKPENSDRLFTTNGRHHDRERFHKPSHTFSKWITTNEELKWPDDPDLYFTNFNKNSSSISKSRINHSLQAIQNLRLRRKRKPLSPHPY